MKNPVLPFILLALVQTAAFGAGDNSLWSCTFDAPQRGDLNHEDLKLTVDTRGNGALHLEGAAYSYLSPDTLSIEQGIYPTEADESVSDHNTYLSASLKGATNLKIEAGELTVALDWNSGYRPRTAYASIQRQGKAQTVFYGYLDCTEVKR